jgi:NADH dehydrogenase [ubiquinone] 1 alpha subcomplex assembly factor 1
MNANGSHTTERLLFDFGSSDKLGHWVIVNDDVMGGQSRSEMRLSEMGTAIFEGILSLENEGGFASVRTTPYAYGLKGYQGLALRVRGDGRRYLLSMRSGRRLDGPSYEVEFDTVPNAWITVYVPFQEAVATFRGRRLMGLPKIQGEQVTQIGLMIADRQSGPFRLEVAWIEAYKPRS